MARILKKLTIDSISNINGKWMLEGAVTVASSDDRGLTKTVRFRLDDIDSSTRLAQLTGLIRTKIITRGEL